MARLVPLSTSFDCSKARRGCPAIRAFTPVFDGLWPGMTECYLNVSRSKAVLTEHKRAQFDAFARGYVSRRGRIDEGAMRREACAAIRFRVVAFQQQAFVRLHGGHVEPAVRRIEGDRIGFAHTVRIDELG